MVFFIRFTMCVENLLLSHQSVKSCIILVTDCFGGEPFVKQSYKIVEILKAVPTLGFVECQDVVTDTLVVL